MSVRRSGKGVIISNNVNDEKFYKIVNSKLTKNQEIKNYQELCGLLDIKTVGGKQKQLQLKNLERFCKLEKNGVKFIVKDIYASPKEKLDKRVYGNHSVFICDIESILLNYFIKQGKTECSFRKKELWNTLAMINDNFYLFYEDKLLFIEALQIEDERIEPWHVNNFYQRVRNKLNELTKSALNNLKNRKLIKWEEVTVARKTSRDGRYKYFDVRDSKDLQKVMECEKAALIKLGCENLKQVIYNKDNKINYDKYAKIRNQELKEELGWDFVFKRYSIICNQKYLEMGLKENEKRLKENFNTKLIEVIDFQADSLYKKNKIKNEEKKKGEKIFSFRKSYPAIQRELSERLLKLNAEPMDNLTQAAIDNFRNEMDELFG